jgi:hypothetical protein
VTEEAAEVTRRLAACGLFAPVTNPASGVTSWRLRNVPHRAQISLYFTEPCSDDRLRVIWFCWALPWAGSAAAGRMLGVANLVTGRVHHFPDHPITDAGASVMARSGAIIWCSGPDLWRRPPAPAARPQRLGGLPFEMTERRALRRLATQPSISADRRLALLDTQLGRRSHIGTLNLATGEYVPLFCSPRNMNHAQFSPTDPRLVLIARDDDTDPDTGVNTPYDHRMFLFHLDGWLMPLGPSGRQVGHEVWSADGQAIWFVDFRRGVMRQPLTGGPAELVWPQTGWHAHASACERFVVADHRVPAREGGPAHAVRFLNRATGREVEIARMPVPAQDRLHRHPHPRFNAADRVIVYTDCSAGSGDVCVVPVAELVAATA